MPDAGWLKGLPGMPGPPPPGTGSVTSRSVPTTASPAVVLTLTDCAPAGVFLPSLNTTVPVASPSPGPTPTHETTLAFTPPTLIEPFFVPSPCAVIVTSSPGPAVVGVNSAADGSSTVTASGAAAGAVPLPL